METKCSRKKHRVSRKCTAWFSFSYNNSTLFCDRREISSTYMNLKPYNGLGQGTTILTRCLEFPNGDNPSVFQGYLLPHRQTL